MHKKTTINRTRSYRCFTKHKLHVLNRQGRKIPLLSVMTFLTLAFKLVTVRDHPCEFGANPFSGSQDIWFTNKQTKKSPAAPKTEPDADHSVR